MVFQNRTLKQHRNQSFFTGRESQKCRFNRSSHGRPPIKIVEEIGGGIPGKDQFKAVQTGGPSGGCIPYSLKDVAVDFDSLTKIGSMMGSGGMIVMDDKDCVVDMARYFLKFLEDESCGKCLPCRLGLKGMLEFLERFLQR